MGRGREGKEGGGDGVRELVCFVRIGKFFENTSELNNAH